MHKEINIIVIIARCDCLGRWLGSDHEHGVQTANGGCLEDAAAADNLPTMWLGAQSGR